MANEEVVGIRLALRDRQRTSQGLQGTRQEIAGLGEEAERTGKRASKGLAALQKMTGAVGRTARTGLVALTGLTAAAATFGLRTAAANEQAQISFTTMLGSASRARSFLGELATFAKNTPFTFPGLQSSASKLLSAGIDAKKIIPIMTSLGNATSGMGTGSEGIERATVALQQMNAAGRISAEDFNQLQDAGIPTFELLAAATGKSVAQVAALRDKGKLGRKELEQLMSALESGKGLERFSGLMAAQSKSLGGMWASLTDDVSQGLAKVMQPWLPTLKVALGALTRNATPFFDSLVDDSDRLARKGMWAVNMLRRGFADAGPTVSAVAGYVRELIAQFRAGEGVDMSAVKTLATSSGVLVANLPALMTNLPSLNSGLQVAGTVTGFLADHIDLLAKFMPIIAAGFVAWKVAQMGANVAAAASVPLRIAEMVTSWKAAGAQRAHTAALTSSTAAKGLNTGATTVGTAAENLATASRARSTVGMAAHRVATLAGAAATTVASIATRLFGGALRFAMGPVGWIITGIAALASGAVYAYKNFGWFKTGVDNTVGGLKVAWEWIKKVGGSVKSYLLDKLQVAADFFKKWAPVIGKVLSFTPAGAAVNLVTDGALTRLPGRAGGGPVTANRPYMVGETRPEIFVPHTSGVIRPQVPTMAEVGGGGAGAPPTVIHAHMSVGGREFAEAVLDTLEDREVRR